MTVRSSYRGHATEIVRQERWIYSDTRILVRGIKDITCGHCGKESTKEGHDYCLKNLPYAMNACCGHGDIEETYIQYWNGHVIKGEKARIIIDTLKTRSNE